MRAHVVAIVGGQHVRLHPWRWQPDMPQTTCKHEVAAGETVWFTVGDKVVLCTACCTKAAEAAKRAAAKR